MRKSSLLRASTLFAAILASSGPLLAGCSSSEPADQASPSPSSKERQRPTPRIVVSYDGGVRVLDAKTFDTVADLPHEGFLRLNSADDSRNVFVTSDAGFELLDTGTWRQAHGDHAHYRVSEPRFTGTRFDGPEAGHVVVHDDRITLFFDGTGEARVLDPKQLMDAGSKGETVPTTDYRSPAAHHGVAVARADGSLVVSRGDEEKRTGVAILDAERKVIAENTECPGLHGEAAASDGVLTFGCENGILIVRGDRITKVAAPDAYGRIGNQKGSDDSPFILGDYKTTPSKDLGDDEIERPRRFTLTDTVTGTLRVVDLPTSYSFRSLARGPEGEAVILGTDGALYVFDPATGRQIARHQVIGEWAEPIEWQEAMPTVYVQGGTAYVSDPRAKTLTAVDLAYGKKTVEKNIGLAPIELVAVTG